MKSTPKSRLSPLARGVLFLLLLSLLLTSCGGDAPPIVTEGLTVLETPSHPPSEEAIAEAEEVLYPLFLLAAERKLGTAVPPGTQRRLADHAKKVALLLADAGVTEEGYLAVTAILARDGEAAIGEWFQESDGGYPRLRALYLSLSEQLSAEAIARLAYRTLFYSYDVRCESARQRYETYGYPHQLIELNRLEAERATLAAEVGEDSFSAALRTLLMLSDLIAEAGGDTDALTSFTPAELTVFLGYIPLDGIRTTPAGWELLLSLAARPAAGGVPSRLLAAAEECGDLPTLAAEMNGILTLLTHLRDGMGKEEAALLRDREYRALLSALAEKLTDGDWALLDALASLPLDRAVYDGLGAAEWGDAYLTYAAATVPISAAELRAAVGTDGFADLLPRYLANITPVLSYMLEGQ